jgi:hypothetical protein
MRSKFDFLPFKRNVCLLFLLPIRPPLLRYVLDEYLQACCFDSPVSPPFP